jgi:branched-chain amino acid transport system substrate-binding protein
VHISGSEQLQHTEPQFDWAAVPQRAAELDVMTFFGPINFREDNRNASRSLPLRQIQDSKRVVIYPSELSTKTCR